MRCCAILLAATSARAHADNALQARGSAEADRPWLELDPVISPRFAGLLVTDQRETRETLRIDARNAITFVLDEWANKEGAIGYRDVRGQGWQASARFTRNFGALRFDATAALGDVDSRFGRGRYRDASVSLVHTTRLSRWMTAWIGLSIGQRTWLGDAPPAGEANATQVMLVIGSTFR